MNKTLLTSIFSIYLQISIAQDPHFTQFYAAPLTANPSYTGFFEDATARIISNHRQQWISPINTIYTTTIQFDKKIGQEDDNGHHPLSMGLLLMNDRGMKGIYKANYFSISGSYHKPLDELSINKIGVGFMATYGNKRVDYSSITFQEQFVNDQFDTNLPSGESGLQQMKPFVSLSAGILFSRNDKAMGSFFDLGCSVFNFNTPRQTLLADQNQRLPLRFSVQSSYQKYIKNDLLLNIKSIYQNQANVNYLLAGLSLAKLLKEEKEDFIGMGVWLRTNDAISPYLFCEFNNIQTGITYDIFSNDIKTTAKPLNSIEFSLQIKLNNND